PDRLVAPGVHDEVSVGLHDGIAAATPGIRCPGRVTAGVEHEVAVGLHHETVVATGRDDSLAGKQEVIAPQDGLLGMSASNERERDDGECAPNSRHAWTSWAPGDRSSRCNR